MEILRDCGDGIVDRREISRSKRQLLDRGGDILGEFVDRALVADVIGAGKEGVRCSDSFFHSGEVHIVGSIHHLCLIENRIEPGNVSREIGQHCDRIIESRGSCVNLSLVGRGELIVCSQFRFGGVISGLCLGEIRSVVVGSIQLLEGGNCSLQGGGINGDLRLRHDEHADVICAEVEGAVLEKGFHRSHRAVCRDAVNSGVRSKLRDADLNRLRGRHRGTIGGKANIIKMEGFVILG